MNDTDRLMITRLVVAVDRMRDQWAESDKDVQTALWQTLHTAADIVAEHFHVYPLAVQP